MQQPADGSAKKRAKDEGMLGSSFTLMRVRGIRIGAHWSWLFVFALVAWSLSSALFPRTYPGLSDNTYLIMGVVAAITFFASILLHELGHALVGIRRGVRISEITLWMFGGVARMERDTDSPTSEFKVAAAGPLVTLLLGGLFIGIAAAADLPEAVDGVATGGTTSSLRRAHRPGPSSPAASRG